MWEQDTFGMTDIILPVMEDMQLFKKEMMKPISEKLKMVTAYFRYISYPIQKKKYKSRIL